MRSLHVTSTLLLVLAWVFVLVVTGTLSAGDSVQLSESFGGPHGTEFSDQASVSAGQTIGSITIRAGERVDGIALEVKGPTAAIFSHGGSSGRANTLTLAADEYISSMEAHWGEKKGRTRIFYLSFGTSAGNSVSGGSQTDSKNTVKAPEGFQLGGFFGQDGDEIDKLGAIWTRISAEAPATEAPVTEAPTAAPAPVPATSTSGSTSSSVEADSSMGSAAEVAKPKKTGKPPTESLVIESADASASAGGVVKPKKSGKRPTTSTAASADESAATSEAESGEGSTDASAAASAKPSTSGSTEPASTDVSTTSSSEGSAAPPKAESAAGSGSGATAPAPAPAGTKAPAGPTMSVKDSVQLSESFGGPHGMDFSDKNFVNSGQTVSSISIHAGERLNGITLQISAPKSLTFTHGGTGGEQKTLKLGPGEYIKSMEVHWGKKNGLTRIFYVNFVTSAGNSLAGGSMTDDKSTVTAPEGFQLAGFFGKDGKEIDTLGAVWAYIELVTPAPTPAPAPVKDEDSPGTVAPADIAGSLSEVKTKANKRAVQLSDSFGGPHGEQFSDQLAVTSGMTVSSVTIRAGERVDGHTVQISAPKEMTFTHGGTGGEDNTLKLEPGEYITTMEVHWGQMGGHTRIFYLSLGTSKGNKVSGGSQTDEKGSVTAPKGYQLAGFFGRYGDEMDLIGAVWSSIAMVNETVSPPVSADGDIVLGELFGGPHGNAFSDINDIKFGARFADTALVIVEGIVKQAITNGDEIISTGANVMNLLTGNEMVNKSATTVDELQDIIDKNSSCGWELKRLTDRVTRAVLKYRNVSDNVDDIRVKVYRSSIVLNDIPIVTNNCMGELLATKTKTAAYETRDLLRKTFGVIVDQLIDTGKTDNGKDVAEDDYMLQVANMGLVVLSTIDPTGIAYMASQFVQPICGPTAYVGEIDDGTLFDALGLTTVDEAFAGSYGSYTHSGDGVVRLIFESVDTKDVTVVVHSGGDGYTKVDIGAGDTVTWESTFPQLEDQTLYLDRWCPGLFGLPGKGGGSLLMWIPRSSEGGHITMHVRINPS
ncbi:hypothetical protein PF010_g13089 [Phytophthora fragariae]|uniref:Jacalin-type lectin domain-containing protein n=1 Tax=Phytophthora fragariae TaxID=53985 RepID=A0A6G0L1R0_9STRA|nr:hypothetical protein PF010_g13089 [Phytophthora fragariae]